MDDAQNFSSLKDPPPEFPVWESKLVGRWGIGRARLLELREAHLVLGVDWARKSRRVCLTTEALAKLEAIIGLEAGKTPQNGESAHPEPLPKPVITFKVMGKKIAHPHMLLATDGQSIFRVRVKRKEHFLMGMDIRCEHDQQDLFNHVGNCPRFRGKY